MIKTINIGFLESPRMGGNWGPEINQIMRKEKFNIKLSRRENWSCCLLNIYTHKRIETTEKRMKKKGKEKKSFAGENEEITESERPHKSF